MAFSRCVAAVRSHLCGLITQCFGFAWPMHIDEFHQNKMWWVTMRPHLGALLILLILRVSFLCAERVAETRPKLKEINLFYSPCEFPDIYTRAQTLAPLLFLLVWTTRKRTVTCGYGNACVWECVWVLSRNWKRHSVCVCVKRPGSCSSSVDAWRCHDKHQGAQIKSRSSTKLISIDFSVFFRYYSHSRHVVPRTFTAF